MVNQVFKFWTAREGIASAAIWPKVGEKKKDMKIYA